MKLKINAILTFLYLAFFSFGQIPALTIYFLVKTPQYIHITDILLVLLLVLNPLKIFKNRVLYILLFSSVLGLTFFGLRGSLPGFLYLIRIVAILNLGIVVTQLIRTKQINAIFFYNALKINVIFVAIWGWVQYILAPDMRTLAILGWDDHLYRLAGSFLDPAFVGILLTLGSLLFLNEFLNKRVQVSLFIYICLVSTILFTYSRASYLSLIVGSAFIVFKYLSFKKVLLFGVLFSVCLLSLPRPGGEGVRLERTYSIILKGQNALGALPVLAKSPVFGIGFNNICVAQKDSLSKQARNDVTKVHSCSGFDNSLLFLLATIGICGVFVIATEGYKKISELKRNQQKLFLASVFSIAIHGMFTNTFVYPWVVGWIVILYVCLKEYTAKD